ncbi:MAG: DUF1648 domain-containing protein [Rhodanobacter sp.]|nr:MAG: DUF1648 domain-containing protein [Rhodanobacter sp.]
MRFTRSLLISAAFVLIGVAVAAWLWHRLPIMVPSHWNWAGEVDGWLPRFWAAAIPSLGVLVLALLTWLLPVVSPTRFRIAPFANVFTGLMLVIQGFILVIGVCVLLAGAGYALPMPRVAMLGASALMMVLGNYMGKLQRNFFIGIRTPWTLASAATWERTHRLAGRLFVIAGLLALLGTAFGLPFWIGVGCILAAVLIPALYSFIIYRRVEGTPED